MPTTTTTKLNCWESKKCQREPGGAMAAELGVCPAAEPSEFDGKNSGSMAGRYCWKVAGTLCDGEVQGSSAAKMLSCSACEFFVAVKCQEGAKFEI